VDTADTQEMHRESGEEPVAPDEGSGEEYVSPDIETRGSLNDVTQAPFPWDGNNQGGNDHWRRFGFS
jgi:hypothetical protein